MIIYSRLKGFALVLPSSHRSYHPSEAVLGNAFEALRDEYPRESYKISSKCGRYSSDGFDYSPANIDASVRRSIALLKCDYLDTICQ